MEADALVPYIVRRFHEKEEALLEKIDGYLRKILKVHYRSHGAEPAQIYAVFLRLKAELSARFAKEEKEVFPILVKGDRSRIGEPEDEYDAAGDLLRALEDRTNGFLAPDDACMTYQLAFRSLREPVDDVHVHIFPENSVLFQEEEK